MKYLLIINALFEGLFGVVAVAAPQVIWAGGDGVALANGRAFGFAALTIALLSVLVVRKLANAELVSSVIVTMVFWHAGATVAQVMSVLATHSAPPPAIIHGVFTIAFAVFLLRSRPAKA